MRAVARHIVAAVFALTGAVLTQNCAASESNDLPNYQVAVGTRILADRVERKFDQIINVMPSVQQVLNSGLDEKSIHLALSKLISAFQHGRSLFLIDDVGIMRINSLEYPAPMLELSDRLYFRKVVVDDGPAAMMGNLLINRLSQQPFIPVAARMRVGSVNWVAVADINPDALIAQSVRCRRCIAWLLTPQGGVLASAPPGQNPPFALLEHIRNEPLGAPKEVNVGMIKSVFSWTKILNGQVIVVYLMEV